MQRERGIVFDGEDLVGAKSGWSSGGLAEREEEEGGDSYVIAWFSKAGQR